MKVPWTLEELLPHRPPMVLVDAVEDFDPSVPGVTVRFTVTERSAFATPDGVPNWVAIEYMAQASAVLAECVAKDEAPGAPPRPGLLLGTRRLSLEVPFFAPGESYRVTARVDFAEADMAAFSCAITDAAGTVVATATLNAYCPEDFVTFMKELI